MPKAVVYSKDNCPHCVRAKDNLDDHGIEYQEIKLGRDLPRDKFLAELTEKIGTTPETVPQIFIDGKHIGGADELEVEYPPIQKGDVSE